MAGATPGNQEKVARHPGKSWNDDLPHGGKTDLIHATIIVGEDIEGYDPAQDLDLYEYFLSDDQGD